MSLLVFLKHLAKHPGWRLIEKSRVLIGLISTRTNPNGY